MWHAGIGGTVRANPWIKRAPEGLSLLNKNWRVFKFESVFVFEQLEFSKPA